MKDQKLNGIWCSLQIPFNKNNSIDYSGLREDIDFLVQSTVRGIYSNGTAGEFFNQTEGEFDKISEMMAHTCMKANIPFQIGASHMSPIISLKRIERTKVLEPNAFQIILPDWLPLNSDEQLMFLERMVETASPIPIVLYNPGHAKSVLKPGDIKRLSDAMPQLAGIKLETGGAGWYNEMRDIELDLSVYVPGHRIASGLNEKIATGSCSNVACINPDAAQKWYEIAMDNIEEGLRIEKEIVAFFKQYVMPLTKTGYSDAAIDKLLKSLKKEGAISTNMRWPYKSFDKHQVIGMREKAKKMLPDFFHV